MQFGEYLREKRQKRGLTQKELGYAGMVDHSTVSRWESGQETPNASHRLALLGMAAKLQLEDTEKSDLLQKAGLAPIKAEEVDVDKTLRMFHERWHKTRYLAYLGWSKEGIADKLGIPFFEVDHDLQKAKEDEDGQMKNKHSGLFSYQPVQIEEGQAPTFCLISHISQTDEPWGSVSGTDLHVFKGLALVNNKEIEVFYDWGKGYWRRSK